MIRIRYLRLLIPTLIFIPLVFLLLATLGLGDLQADQQAQTAATPDTSVTFESLALSDSVMSPSTPPQPYGPAGTVKNQGANVTDGTAVTASCNGVVYAAATTINTLEPVESWYALIIPGDDPAEDGLQGCLPLENIVFTIGGQTAYQTVQFIPGSGLLELTIDEPEPGIDLEKFTNGENADFPTGPTLALSSTVTWTYALTNSGNVTLIDIEVWDDYGTPGVDSDDKMACSYERLAPNDPQNCIITGTVSSGQYTNLGAADGTFNGSIYGDTDSSHYLGVQPALILDKLTNGYDADTSPGPELMIGDPITWTYVVTNSGDLTLADIEVTDDNGTPDNPSDDEDVCVFASLAPGESDQCLWSGNIAIEGQYKNIGTARAVIGGLPVYAYDPSHYYCKPDNQFLYLPMLVR